MFNRETNIIDKNENNKSYIPSSIIQNIIITNSQNVKCENLLNGMNILKRKIQELGYLILLEELVESYNVYGYKPHRYSVPIFNYYTRSTANSVNVSFGNSINFMLNNTDQFIADIVLNIKIDQIGDSSATGPAITRIDKPQFHYCDYPGVRLCKNSQFEIDGILYEEYEPKNVMVQREFDIPQNYKKAWDTCHGQEQEVDGFVYMPDSQSKIKQSILNGPQTPKTYQPPLDLWIKGNFFFNSFDNPLPVGNIYTKSRSVTYELEKLSNILYVRLDGQSYGYGTPEAISAAARLNIILPPAPKILSANLYINNISMDPDIYSIYIKQIGYIIYRLHNSYKIQISTSEGSQLLDHLRYATESIRFGLQPVINKDIMDAWYKFHDVTQHAIPVPIYLNDPNNVSPILSIANVRFRSPILTVDKCGFYIKGQDNKLYDFLSPTFYSSYLQTRINMLYAPDDPGLMSITFNRVKDDNAQETNGYLDLTQMRELYFNWISSYINMNNPVELFICTKSINIVEINEDNSNGYRLRFFM
jgi:hypothetical protein